MTASSESVVEQAALAWLESASWQVRNGTEIAPGEPAAERDDFGQVGLAQNWREPSLLCVVGELRPKAAARLVGRTV